jgi:hypothetical protein
MFESFENCIRFGDGVFGAVPPLGATVRLEGCQFLEGPAALVAEGQLKHLLNAEIVLDLALTESLGVVANTDAEGGENFPVVDEIAGAGTSGADERIRRGSAFATRRGSSPRRSRARATRDFNTFQRNSTSAVTARRTRPRHGAARGRGHEQEAAARI